MKRSSIFNRLALQKNQIASSKTVKDRLEPGILDKQIRRAGDIVVNPENSRVVSAKVPDGNVIQEMAVVESTVRESQKVTIYIDMRNEGTTAETVDVRLFDHYGFHASGDGMVGAFPAGTVTMPFRGRDVYGPWMNKHCKYIYDVFGIRMEALPTNSAEANAPMQFGEHIHIARSNESEEGSTFIDPSQYVEPTDFKDNILTMDLKGVNAVIDGHTAWYLKVYKGMLLKLTFEIAMVRV
jgi:hypothetical protein